MSAAARRLAASRRGAASGFTLIELLVTIALIAILLSLAAPSFEDASVNSKLSDNANRLAASAGLARGEAIKRNAVVVLCTSADGESCAGSGGWEQGWIVFHDANRNAARDAGEALIQAEQAAPTGYRLTEGSSPARLALSFTPTSVGTTSGVWTVCRATPTVSTQQRTVQVSATGRPSVTRATGTTCS